MPLVCSVISAAFLCADHSQLGRLDVADGFHSGSALGEERVADGLLQGFP
jgi:hypothetical protein